MGWKDTKEEDGVDRGKKAEEKRVCIQVWGTARWIPQPNGQLITVRERARSEERVERRDGREGGGD